MLRYRKYYIASTKYYTRFIFNLIVFVLSMIVLSFSNNWFLTFVGWDGLGLSSYFLVIFYITWSTVNSGASTIFINRLGDLFFVVSLRLLLENILVVVLGVLFSLIKSAQFPFSSWLLLAIAAPTPIRALLHSRTLVVAGVFICIKNLEYFSCRIKIVLVIVALLTLYHSGLFSLFEIDFKKIVALSTLFRIALIMLALGMRLKVLSYFYINTHAFFKSMLFVAVGVMIHSNFSNQDSRVYTSSRELLTRLAILVAVLNLISFIFTRGASSKELIVEHFKTGNSTLLNILLLTLLYLVVFLTFVYSFRILFIFLIRTTVPILTAKTLVVLLVTSIFWGIVFWKNTFYLLAQGTAPNIASV